MLSAAATAAAKFMMPARVFSPKHLAGLLRHNLAASSSRLLVATADYAARRRSISGLSASILSSLLERRPRHHPSAGQPASRSTNDADDAAADEEFAAREMSTKLIISRKFTASLLSLASLSVVLSAAAPAPPLPLLLLFVRASRTRRRYRLAHAQLASVCASGAAVDSRAELAAPLLVATARAAPSARCSQAR